MSRKLAGSPVAKNQPAVLAPKASAYSFNTSGTSCSGSTVTEMNTILVPKSEPSRSCTNDIIGVSTGQVSVQRVKMKVTATTLPRKSERLTGMPACEVSVNCGAGPIFGSGDCAAGFKSGWNCQLERDANARTVTAKEASATKAKTSDRRMVNRP